MPAKRSPRSPAQPPVSPAPPPDEKAAREIVSLAPVRIKIGEGPGNLKARAAAFRRRHRGA